MSNFGDDCSGGKGRFCGVKRGYKRGESRKKDWDK